MIQENNKIQDDSQSLQVAVMPRFFCEKCDTNIGCSYYNFGVLCDEELKFKNKIMETFYSKIDRRLKELKEKKELVEKSNFLNINKSVELRILDRCINELNDLLNDKS